MFFVVTCPDDKMFNIDKVVGFRESPLYIFSFLHSPQIDTICKTETGYIKHMTRRQDLATGVLPHAVSWSLAPVFVCCPSYMLFPGIH